MNVQNAPNCGQTAPAGVSNGIYHRGRIGMFDLGSCGYCEGELIMQLPNFEVTVKMPDGTQSKRIQPAHNATSAGKFVRAFYYAGQNDVKISAKKYKQGAV